ncbi:MAG: HAD family hydrolase, partial [Promethearchaeota archaeon]
ASSISHLVRPNKVITKLLKASEAVNTNDGNKTNEQVFLENFFPIEGYHIEDIQPLFDRFYETQFSELRKYTNKKPEARSVMNTVFEKGYEVVIATTPVLPLTAIQQRLNWAGVGDFNYKLITTIENSRANKPHLSYYKQIIDFLGYSAKHCLMVGDEDKDMIAKNIGCQTFLIYSSNTDLKSGIPEPNYKGTLHDIIEIL